MSKGIVVGCLISLILVCAVLGGGAIWILQSDRAQSESSLRADVGVHIDTEAGAGGAGWCSNLVSAAAEYNGTAMPSIPLGDVIDVTGPASLHPEGLASELTTALKAIGKNVTFYPWFGIVVADGEHILIQAQANTHVYVYDEYAELESFAQRWSSECDH